MTNSSNPLETDRQPAEPGFADSETSLIARYFRPLAEGYVGARGLIDDAATIAPPEGTELVVTTDALVGGVHFLIDDDPADIAFKSLAVNVSDLAAKAAAPIAYSLALILPRGQPLDWLTGFASGLREAQTAFGIAMSGGDTTSSPNGPLMISVTAFGHVPHGRMVPRSGAKPGDAIYVSGTIGDAALGLQVRLGAEAVKHWQLTGEQDRALVARYLRPRPRLALRAALLEHANAAMDISDGLGIDCERMCKASGVSADIEVQKVPLSDAASRAASAEPAAVETILTGGDDYEILAAVPPDRQQGFEEAAASQDVLATKIGTFSAGREEVRFLAANGTLIAFSRLGYDHLQ